MNSPDEERRTFRPSLGYLVLEGVFFAVIVAPLWWGPWALLISVVVVAVAIAVARWRHSIVVRDSVIIGPSPTPFRRRRRIRVADAMLKSSDWSWYPHEIGSNTGDDRIAVWMLGKTEREALFRTLSIDLPKDRPTP